MTQSCSMTFLDLESTFCNDYCLFSQQSVKLALRFGEVNPEGDPAPHLHVGAEQYPHRFLSAVSFTVHRPAELHSAPLVLSSVTCVQYHNSVMIFSRCALL